VYLAWTWGLPRGREPGVRFRKPQARSRDRGFGTPQGDALAAVAACVHAAIAWHGRPETAWDALIGRFGLAAALAPAPGS
jgi:hypothetical protein